MKTLTVWISSCVNESGRCKEHHFIQSAGHYIPLIFYITANVQDFDTFYLKKHKTKRVSLINLKTLLVILFAKIVYE